LERRPRNTQAVRLDASELLGEGRRRLSTVFSQLSRLYTKKPEDLGGYGIFSGEESACRK